MSTNKKPQKKLTTPPRCDRKRCMNDAQMFPIIVVPSPSWSTNKKAKIEMEMSLNVCPTHAVQDITLFLDDAGWEELIHNFAVRRLALPKRNKLYVKFQALEDRQVVK